MWPPSDVTLGSRMLKCFFILDTGVAVHGLLIFPLAAPIFVFLLTYTSCEKVNSSKPRLIVFNNAIRCEAATDKQTECRDDERNNLRALPSNLTAESVLPFRSVRAYLNQKSWKVWHENDQIWSFLCHAVELLNSTFFSYLICLVGSSAKEFNGAEINVDQLCERKLNGCVKLVCLCVQYRVPILSLLDESVFTWSQLVLILQFTFSVLNCSLSLEPLII